MAQTPANRTAKTTAADVLAQMPAAKQAAYNKLIGDLSSTGEEGVLMLVNMINAPGKGSNAKCRLCLERSDALCHGKRRGKCPVGYCQRLSESVGMVNERETKAFIIRQLQMLGKVECIDVLASYLNDESLSGPAARALASNGSQKAGQALVAALKSRTGSLKTQKDVVRAIADARVTDAEPVLQALLGVADPNMQKVVLYALSRVGTNSSMKLLADAAAEAGYAMDNSGATEAYIALLKNLVSPGDPAGAVKAAKKLQKEAAKAGQEQTREAALQILLAAEEPAKSI